MIRRRNRIALAVAVAALAAGAPVARADFLAPVVADGPSDITAFGGLDIAHDGTGSLAYLKREGGQVHVFASVLDRGAPLPPVRVDTGQTGDSSDARIAVGDEGRAVAAWLNGGALWASARSGADAPWSPPVRVYGGSAAPVGHPSLDMSLLGTAHVAFTVGGDVLVARMDRQTPNVWSVLPRPVDIDPADRASEPDLASSADGSAIVVWTEARGDGRTHVFERRVTDYGTLSDFPREASVTSLDGRPGGNADSPSVTVQDASSWAFVAFRQDFLNGGATMSRAVGARLVDSQFEPARAIDALRWGSADGAASSQIFIGGRGWGSWATALRSGGVAGGGISRIGDIGVHWHRAHLLGSSGNGAPPPITTTMSEVLSGVVAWQASPPGVAPAIQARHWDEDHFDPTVTLSPPNFGPAAAQLGFGAAADGRTDFVVGFLQGAPGARRVVTVTWDGLLRPAAVTEQTAWTHHRRPKLRWSGLSNVIWGPVTYLVKIDGLVVAATRHTHWRPRKPLPDGAHAVEIVQVDGRGAQSPGIVRSRRIDTHSPVVKLRRAHGRYRVSASDGPAIEGSGVASLRVLLYGGRSVSVHVPAIGIVQNARVRGRPRWIVATDKARNTTSVSARAALRKHGAR